MAGASHVNHFFSIFTFQAGLALEFHLAEAHGDAEGDVARAVAGGIAAGDVGVGVGRGTRIGVEDILDVEVER